MSVSLRYLKGNTRTDSVNLRVYVLMDFIENSIISPLKTRSCPSDLKNIFFRHVLFTIDFGLGQSAANNTCTALLYGLIVIETRLLKTRYNPRNGNMIKINRGNDVKSLVSSSSNRRCIPPMYGVPEIMGKWKRPIF